MQASRSTHPARQLLPALVLVALGLALGASAQTDCRSFSSEMSLVGTSLQTSYLWGNCDKIDRVRLENPDNSVLGVAGRTGTVVEIDGNLQITLSSTSSSVAREISFPALTLIDSDIVLSVSDGATLRALNLPALTEVVDDIRITIDGSASSIGAMAVPKLTTVDDDVVITITNGATITRLDFPVLASVGGDITITIAGGTPRGTCTISIITPDTHTQKLAFFSMATVEGTDLIVNGDIDIRGTGAASFGSIVFAHVSELQGDERPYALQVDLQDQATMTSLEIGDNRVAGLTSPTFAPTAAPTAAPTRVPTAAPTKRPTRDRRRSVDVGTEYSRQPVQTSEDDHEEPVELGVTRGQADGFQDTRRERRGSDVYVVMRGPVRLVTSGSAQIVAAYIQNSGGIEQLFLQADGSSKIGSVAVTGKSGDSLCVRSGIEVRKLAAAASIGPLTLDGLSLAQSVLSICMAYPSVNTTFPTTLLGTAAVASVGLTPKPCWQGFACGCFDNFQTSLCSMPSRLSDPLNTTPFPTGMPTSPPTLATSAPTGVPTGVPTGSPSGTPTGVPTGAPSGTPTGVPTKAPTTRAPTGAPTTSAPTGAPTTSAPTGAPTTSAPTGAPTAAPTTQAPTPNPSATPTTAPSPVPTPAPSPVPTHPPTTPSPTRAPTTPSPTSTPTTSAPTGAPTSAPTFAFQVMKLWFDADFDAVLGSSLSAEAASFISLHRSALIRDSGVQPETLGVIVVGRGSILSELQVRSNAVNSIRTAVLAKQGCFTYKGATMCPLDSDPSKPSDASSSNASGGGGSSLVMVIAVVAGGVVLLALVGGVIYKRAKRRSATRVQLETGGADLAKQPKRDREQRPNLNPVYEMAEMRNGKAVGRPAWGEGERERENSGGALYEQMDPEGATYERLEQVASNIVYDAATMPGAGGDDDGGKEVYLQPVRLNPDYVTGGGGSRSGGVYNRVVELGMDAGGSASTDDFGGFENIMLEDADGGRARKSTMRSKPGGSAGADGTVDFRDMVRPVYNHTYDLDEEA